MCSGLTGLLYDAPVEWPGSAWRLALLALLWGSGILWIKIRPTRLASTQFTPRTPRARRRRPVGHSPSAPAIAVT